jgi:hypothetical protein
MGMKQKLLFKRVSVTYVFVVESDAVEEVWGSYVNHSQRL